MSAKIIHTSEPDAMTPGGWLITDRDGNTTFWRCNAARAMQLAEDCGGRAEDMVSGEEHRGVVAAYVKRLAALDALVPVPQKQKPA